MSTVIIGAGTAGLTAALCIAPQKVIVLSAGSLGTGAASEWAQGGIAAAIGADDSVSLHVADTLMAGVGLCDRTAVARIIEAGPWAIEFLRRQGTKFEETLGLEAAHSRRRIVHAKDKTGAEVMRSLIAAARAAPSITILENTEVRHLFVRDNEVIGVQTNSGDMQAGAVIIATGGIGGLFAHTTNPLTATGSGLALAARAGAALRDLEFVQFHPTALECGRDPMPLVSEALRGEGAVFVDGQGTRFMNGGELGPRDVVARAVSTQIAAGGKVFLDARGLDARLFPGVFAICRANGIDPATQPIPVRPAAHYHMGGIAVNGQSETSISGLFACGEAASTGLHGANRLASNSLLEAVVTARFAAEAIAGRILRKPQTLPSAPSPSAVIDLPLIRKICSQSLGILRNADALTCAIATLVPLAATSDAAFAALLIAQAALRRRDSIGAHFRTDAMAVRRAA